MAVYLGSNQVGVTIGAAAQKEEGSSSVQDVNFYDYDGTLIKSYTAEEWQSNGSLPANPSHEGLVAQGWNWTKAQIDSYLTDVGGAVNVGQMYTTESGDTEIDVKMQEGRLSPIMTIAVNGTITIDWGDNTTPDTVTGSSLTSRLAPTHTYSSAGNYTIKIHVLSGLFSFYGGSTYQILRKNTTASQNRVYSNCIREVRIGTGITKIDNYAFSSCYSLASITIPDTITSIGSDAFSSCYSLVSITIPDTITSISTYTFSNCYSLASITIPNTVMSIGGNTFSSCYSLASITIPDTITSISNYTFSNCHSFASITIPDTITSIGNYVFSCCYSLANVTIPDTITSIGNYAFQYCYGMAEYHFKSTTPPTLKTKVLEDITSDCKIYVPAASLSDYQSATNWSTYASYMVGE